ncbi:condensation domain-containing protein [Amycolatopsis australiensis]|uniref:Condensation domain-containing protein n=1 Tax=Amycolatopsis australiensis TaxID=546364 RepID=A0A1K1RKD9_9PSEU|nr:condensation domain-containing protein [Amycolatopsis australiensis]SFW72477.1 Condensation domain-containing protein [Amycolatopsis australiensis]
MTVEQRPPELAGGVVSRPLSANEKFLCSLDRGDDFGVFGVRGIVMGGWRLRGPLDVPSVQLALNDVVARHEVLRTAIVRDAGTPYARVHPPCPAELTVVDLPPEGGDAEREQRAHEFLNEVDDRGSCDPAGMPLLRATLGRFDDGDAVLALVTHHSVSDGWSIHLLMRDFAVCYAKRRGLPAPELPEVRQYGEYAEWQQRARETASAAAARQYWQDKLAGGRFLTLPTDRPRRDVPPVYSVYRFVYEEELVSATTSLAKSLHSSPFMVLFACFALFLHRRTGVRDILTPIFTSGRTEPEFEQTVGPLFNFVPIRIDLTGCATFAELVHRARATLLEAYTHELPFSEIATQAAPELMEPIMRMNGVTTGFETFQYPQELAAKVIGGVRYTGLSRRLISSTDTSEIPDGNLWDFALDPAGDLVGAVRFNGLDFDQQTIVAMIDEYRELLRAALKSPDAALPR